VGLTDPVDDLSLLGERNLLDSDFLDLSSFVADNLNNLDSRSIAEDNRLSRHQSEEALLLFTAEVTSLDEDFRLQLVFLGASFRVGRE